MVLVEYPIDNLPAETMVRSELLDGLSGKVFVDKILSVKVVPAKCHVYNLQTENGYYFVNSSIPQNEEKSNGIFAISKNCRCTTITVEPEHITKGEEPRMTYSEWAESKEGRKAVRKKHVEEKKPIPISPKIAETLKDYSNGEYGYYCEYSQALVSKTGEDFEKAVAKVDKYRSGNVDNIGIDEAKKRTKEIIDIIGSQPVSETPLYRIDRWSFDKAEGDIIEWGIHSTSRDSTFADRVLGGNERGFVTYAEKLNKRPTVFEIVGKKKHLDISEYSDFDQQESLICGKFRVVKIIEPDLTISIKKQKFEDAVEDFPEQFSFFKSKSGKNMVRMLDGKTYTVEQMQYKDFYNGTLDLDLEGGYERERKSLEKKPRRVQIEQIFE